MRKLPSFFSPRLIAIPYALSVIWLTLPLSAASCSPKQATRDGRGREQIRALLRSTNQDLPPPTPTSDSNCKQGTIYRMDDAPNTQLEISPG